MQHLKESENAHLGPIIGFGHLVMSEMFLTGGGSQTHSPCKGFGEAGWVVPLPGFIHAFAGLKGIFHSFAVSKGNFYSFAVYDGMSRCMRVIFILSRCMMVFFILSRCMRVLVFLILSRCRFVLSRGRRVFLVLVGTSGIPFFAGFGGCFLFFPER